MARGLLIFLVATICMGNATFSQAGSTGLSPKSVVGKIHTPIRPFTTEHMGTAWCLDMDCGLMLTTYHVVGVRATEFSVNGHHVVHAWLATGPDDFNTRPVPAASGTQILNISRDLAILQMEKPLSQMHGVRIFPGKLQDGETVTILSYPGGKLTATTAHFRSTIEQGVLEFDLDSILMPGCSGGLILNSHHQAVGVLFALTHNWHTAFAVPVWSLADFIKIINPILYAELFPVAPVRPDLSYESEGRYSGEAAYKTVVQHAEPQVEIVEASVDDRNEHGNLKKIECLRKPARPTTAVEIYHYVLAKFPLERDESDSELYFKYKIDGGITMGDPYRVTEPEALARLQSFFYQPPPGTSSREIAAFLDLLNPPAQTHQVALDKMGTDFRVDVEAAKIPAPEGWGVILNLPSPHSTARTSGAADADECRIAPSPEVVRPRRDENGSEGN